MFKIHDMTKIYLQLSVKSGQYADMKEKPPERELVFVSGGLSDYFVN